MKFFNFALAIVVVTCLSLIALGQDKKRGEPEKKSREWGQEQEGLRLSIHTDKLKQRAGEGIVLTITLQNHTSEERNGAYEIQEITVEPPKDYAAYNTWAGKPEGKSENAELTKHGARWKFILRQSGRPGSAQYRPGHGQIDRYLLNQIYDMTFLGEYKISVKAKFLMTSWVQDGNDVKLKAGKELTLTSNEVVVKVEEVYFPKTGAVEIVDP